MNDTSKNLNELYDDIDLCYKVMGLTFSDPPEKVDKVYQGLLVEYQKALRSSDPSTCQNAKMNIEQVRDLYERITSSLIYKNYAQEYEKYKQVKAERVQAKKQKQQMEKAVLVSCPYCRKLISSKLKVCIYCHGKIRSPMELMMRKVFSTRNMVVASIVAALIVAVVILAMNPQLF